MYCRKLCQGHYAKAWRCRSGDAGKLRRVDSGPAIAHLHKLRDLGWTWQLISDRSGTSMFTARNAFYRGTISHAVSESLLALPLEEMHPPHRMVDPTGTRRRVEALNYRGWSRRVLAGRMGMAPPSLSRMLRSGRVTSQAALQVAALFAELGDREGPSDQVALRSRLADFQPAMAWEYVDIDDPKAKPYGGFARSA
jgi:lambda repressor-like predicted transcriptional regulator